MRIVSETLPEMVGSAFSCAWTVRTASQQTAKRMPISEISSCPASIVLYYLEMPNPVAPLRIGAATPRPRNNSIANI